MATFEAAVVVVVVVVTVVKYVVVDVAAYNAMSNKEFKLKQNEKTGYFQLMLAISKPGWAILK